MSACGRDNVCAEACRADHPCGAQSPRRVNVTTAPTSDGEGEGGDGGDQVYTSFEGQDEAVEGNAAVREGRQQ